MNISGIKRLLDEHKDIREQIRRISDPNLLESKVITNKDFYYLVVELCKLNYDTLGLVIDLEKRLDSM